MSETIRDLIQGHLDGSLSATQETELNAWVKAAPANARQFVEAVQMHDRLRSVFCDPLACEEVSTAAADHQRSSIMRPVQRWPLLGGALALVASMLLALWLVNSHSTSAATEIARLIENSAQIRDRTYRIRNLDTEPEKPEPRRPPLDGATLHVRNPDQFVLIRYFDDGTTFINGSDGEQNWSVPPGGAIHTSRDPIRFRGPLPGHEHGIPFVDLRSDLLQLRDAYHLTVIPPAANGWQGLLAEKKSTDYRGPRQVEIWYEPQSGVIQKMVFNGMPKARGGPNHLAVELIDQRELTKDFFHHEAHHESSRPVDEE